MTQVQPLTDDGFLLIAPRVGNIWEPQNAMIVAEDGSVRQRFTLADGTEHVQVDPAGGLWVSYFDEGNFNDLDLPAEGLVWFGADLNPALRFNTLARDRDLLQMYDCYALNIASPDDAYTCA